MSRRDLTPLEARVLAVLVEKESTVPDSYPLSANALTAGCNQKTARDPVMDVSEAEVLATVEELKALHLVNTVSGSRVVRYEHNFARGLGVPGAAMALLTQLMLRGPQTAAELRQNTERLHRFADVSSVEGFLEELAGREQPFAVKLPKAPGAREARWAHLLCGPVASVEHAVAAALPRDEEVALLRAEVASLRQLVNRIAAELGIAP
ncbi:YceH family protein [Roseateles sp. BYS78W]|uniref:YceH family protein n=1 Tax=Pelomonas candidula TaxID=3299025 RepID=A0ABW7H8F5_9BURK